MPSVHGGEEGNRSITLTTPMTDTIDNPDTDWNIGSPTCPNCNSLSQTHLVIQSYDREMTEFGGVVGQQPDTEYDVLEARCEDCRMLLHRSEGYVALLEQQRE